MGCILWEAKLFLSTDTEQWVRKMKNMLQIHPGWPLDYPVVVLQFLRSFCSVTFPFSIIINLSIYLDSPKTQTTLFYSFPVLLPNTFTDKTRIQSQALHFSSISHLLGKYGWKYNYSVTHLTEGEILKRWFLVSIQVQSECMSLNVPGTQALNPMSGAGKHISPKLQSAPWDINHKQWMWGCSIHGRSLFTYLQLVTKGLTFCLRCQET